MSVLCHERIKPYRAIVFDSISRPGGGFISGWKIALATAAGCRHIPTLS